MRYLAKFINQENCSRIEKTRQIKQHIRYIILYLNKTAGHHRHIFSPLTLQKIPFRRMKACVEKNVSSANFDDSSKFKIFLIAVKTQFRWKKTFSWNIIWYTLYNKFATFTFFDKIEFFFEKTHIVPKKISYVFKKFFISVAFYGKFAIIWWGKNFKFITVEHRTLSTSVISNRQVSVKNTFTLNSTRATSIITAAFP